jgi:hypothetical protein
MRVGDHIRPRIRVPESWNWLVGVAIGATAATDHLIVKAIFGRRFDWSRRSPID